MVLCDYTSITKWISKMRSYPFYAIISGFRPFDVPDVGISYDFMNPVMSRRPNEGKGLSRRKRKPDEKGEPKHSGIIELLAIASFLQEAATEIQGCFYHKGESLMLFSLLILRSLG
jgi:hypothetical protein